MTQNILITGSSSGFGLLTAQKLLASGYKVIASMRDPEGRNKDVAETLKNKGAIVVNIDVTDEKSVTIGIKEAIDQAGGIDVVINNAGVGVSGLMEAFTIDDWKKLFDLNVFGVQRVNRAVLPHLRSKREGLLIHVSSLLGRFVLPFMGPYNASKHALEGLADNYRVELSGLGIESVIVEPGAFGTDFSSRLIKPSDSQVLSSYGELAQAPDKQMEEFGKIFENDNAPKAEMVADAIIKLIETPRGERPFRTVVDGLGMGNPIESINQASDQATKAIYQNIGMDNLLKVQK